TDYRGLGRDLGTDLTSMAPATAWDRVRRAIGIDPQADGDWDGERDVGRIVRQGRGRPAERGAVLIHVLRRAGRVGAPPLGRPVCTPGAAPLSVPAAALLPRPVVVVATEQGRIWIDPASEHVAVPQTPASVKGGVAWIAGDLPMQVGARGPNDGRV